MTSEFKPGIVVPLRPFFGSMGIAPAPERGRVSSNPPGRHAGNLDNRELVAVSTLYIPVFVPGALFVVGDGHAAQGDGEVSQTAIETSLRGRLQLTVREGMTLTWPRAETAADYISMATDEDPEGGDDHRDPGDGGLSREHEESVKARGLSASPATSPLRSSSTGRSTEFTYGCRSRRSSETGCEVRGHFLNCSRNFASIQPSGHEILSARRPCGARRRIRACPA